MASIKTNISLTGTIQVADNTAGPFTRQANGTLGETGGVPRPIWAFQNPAATGAFMTTKTVLAGASLDLDFFSGTLMEMAAIPLVWSRLLFLLCQVVKPDGIKLIQVGPQGVANSVDLRMGGVAAANSQASADTVLCTNGLVGYAVAAGSKIVRIKNISAVDLDVSVLAIGKV
ncbi:hypothetical protein KIH39_00050 [Telmatocola sphagniphila]|uniref:Uncharacterized protein n=1 Tax=Telmatocola sphagniphila TaxID=1123043 RepID=A0A8E6B718_9BACT|nr:hypothetical protein [Telmatocola sphagniphila]QVL32346.1 hypothetical protein KIH39_00050 [Telmatocola sphagniphila]